jgi:hypothetical protein
MTDFFLALSPSADTVTGFQERTRVESGLTVGPRIFTVGNIVYGAASGSSYHDITNMKEAHEALTQIKVEGGPASFSYKNYQLPSRCVQFLPAVLHADSAVSAVAQDNVSCSPLGTSQCCASLRV